MGFQRDFGCFGDFVAAVGGSAGAAIGILIPDVEFSVLQQGLGGLKGALVVGIVAHQHFIEQRRARCPQRQQHGQHDEHNHNKQRHTTLARSPLVAW